MSDTETTDAQRLFDAIRDAMVPLTGALVVNPVSPDAVPTAALRAGHHALDLLLIATTVLGDGDALDETLAAEIDAYLDGAGPRRRFERP